MFVQVIRGAVTDPAAARAAFDKWYAELAPGAIGWLGSTAGVTADSRLVVLARFSSAEEAERNSDRPEQGEWWAETASIFTGEPSFDNSVDVDVDVVGDPDRAGFVQVIRTQVSDVARARDLMRQDPELWAKVRPEILGSVTAVHEGGHLTTAVYFTSEEEARRGEAAEPDPAMSAVMEEMQSLRVGEAEFFDLTDPWLHSAARSG